MWIGLFIVLFADNINIDIVFVILVLIVTMAFVVLLSVKISPVKRLSVGFMKAVDTGGDYYRRDVSSVYDHSYDYGTASSKTAEVYSMTHGSGATMWSAQAAGQRNPNDPYFDSTTAVNITTEHGTNAYLPCRVRQLNDRMVSWIRRKDFQILTVGLETHSTDQRFQMIHHLQQDDWTLLIKYAQPRDTGTYECQVSSDPTISLFVTLNVVVAKAEIVGGPDLYAKSGSTITLTCLITQSPEPPQYVFWYREDKTINLNFDKTRGGLTVKTDKGNTTASTLTITNPQRSDSGNYSCAPSNADPASITVHVLNGEKPEAIQSSGFRLRSDFGISCATELFRFVLLPLGVLLFKHAMSSVVQTQRPNRIDCFTRLSPTISS